MIAFLLERVDGKRFSTIGATELFVRFTLSFFSRAPKKVTTHFEKVTQPCSRCARRLSSSCARLPKSKLRLCNADVFHPPSFLGDLDCWLITLERRRCGTRRHRWTWSSSWLGVERRSLRVAPPEQRIPLLGQLRVQFALTLGDRAEVGMRDDGAAQHGLGVRVPDTPGRSGWNR